MMLLIDTCISYDANGSPINYFIIRNKKIMREFDTKEQLLEYMKHYLNGNFRECERIGKLRSVLSESE